MTNRTGRMLVVDDERVITFAIQSYFNDHGFEVDCASEREEALALLTHKEYDIVIADLRLTGTTSEEGLDVIRLARDRNSSTGIILLTAYLDAEVEQSALKLGADLLFQKPQPLPDLAKAVFQLLSTSCQ